MILPMTAEKNAGLCAQCAKTPSYLREKSRVFKAKIANGDLKVSDHSLLNAKSNEEIGMFKQRWSLDPEYYEGQDLKLVEREIENISNLENGSLHILSDLGARINFVFNSEYGVCEYHDREWENFAFAYNEANMVSQVAGEAHLIQLCPCCGVDLMYYSSHCHMPRNDAFNILASIVGVRKNCNSHKWVEFEDLSYNSKGFG